MTCSEILDLIEQELKDGCGELVCPHSLNIGDCQKTCKKCGHRCSSHFYDKPTECMECECNQWDEP